MSADRALSSIARPRATRASAMTWLAVTVAACAGAGPETRDVVPQSRDVVADGGSAGAASYERVVRRPLAIVGLLGARGIEAPDAAAAVDRLADAIDGCAASSARAGHPVQGSARLVAQVDPSGSVGGVNLRLDPGVSASDAVLCIIPPAKALVFPPSDAGARGLAIEATWGTAAISAADAG